MKNARSQNREGFWGKEGSCLPTPQPAHVDPWPGKTHFLIKLAEVERASQNLICRGFSRCRICNKTNGSVTYIYKGWEWPSGFRHYVEEHNVRPSLAFEEFIIGAMVQ